MMPSPVRCAPLILPALLLLAACSGHKDEGPPPKVTEQPSGGDLLVTCETGTEAHAGGTVTLSDNSAGITRTATLVPNMSKTQVCDAIRTVAQQIQLPATSEGDGSRLHLVSGGTTLYVLGARISVTQAGAAPAQAAPAP